MRPTTLLLALLAAAVPAGAAVEAAATGADFYGVDPDFMAYAGTADVTLAGGNPYDSAQLLAAQKTRGLRRDQAVMVWNPPWVLPLFAPLGLLPHAAGQALWTAAMAAALFGGAWLLWPAFGGAPGARLPAALLATATAPAYWTVVLGQFCALPFLGLAGFVAGVRAGRPFLAGAALALTAVKPHLLLPFAATLLADAALGGRSRGAVLVGAGWLAAASAAAVALLPTAWGDWGDTIAGAGRATHVGLGEIRPPVPGHRLREALGLPLAGQFLLGAAACVGAAVYRLARPDWDWAAELPRLAALSFLTAGYGGWWFDLVVLLALPLDAAARLAANGRDAERVAAAAAFVAWNSTIHGASLPPVWWAPLLTAGYLIVAWRVPPAGRGAP